MYITKRTRDMTTSGNHRLIDTETIAKEARAPEPLAGLLAIWEVSVRASHHFLTEADIRNLRPQAEEAIRQIETLWTADHDNSGIGFMGIQSVKIEMLFLRPDYFRKGVGSALIRKAFSELGVQHPQIISVAPCVFFISSQKQMSLPGEPQGSILGKRFQFNSSFVV